MYTCAHCENDVEATLKQEPLCQDHAEQRLEQLKSDLKEIEEEFEKAKEKYNKIRDELDVNSYGQAEHQLNVENREDITEHDVNKINEIEVQFSGSREKYKHLKRSVNTLESQLS